MPPPAYFKRRQRPLGEHIPLWKNKWLGGCAARLIWRSSGISPRSLKGTWRLARPIGCVVSENQANHDRYGLIKHPRFLYQCDEDQLPKLWRKRESEFG